LNSGSHIGATNYDVINTLNIAVVVYPERCRRISLGIKIDYQYCGTKLSQGSSNVHSGRGLPHAAFLVCHGKNTGLCGQWDLSLSQSVPALSEIG
jgi:hypothetical protein